jgi:DMSO/TMAO reductase YedYZ molybdopterin-dependent catalytic subunit
MNPISARTASQNYIQQAQFFPDQPKLQSKKETGPPQATPSLNPGLTKNPFLQRLDAEQDARNIPREMRSGVYENNIDREIESAKQLTDRQFSYRFLPEQEQSQITSIKAFELLRPKTDDYQKSYR